METVVEIWERKLLRRLYEWAKVMYGGERIERN